MNEQDRLMISTSPAKRKRVTKACQVCARSRRKCDGQQPLCQTCRTQGLTCTWSDLPSRRGPPKGYKRGTADPSSLVPKISKISEQIKALQSAYGERIVLSQLHKAIFNNVPCDAYVDVDTEGFEEIGKEELDSLSIHDMASSSTIRTDSSVSDAGMSSQVKPRSDCSQDDDHAHSDIDEGSSSGMAFLATSMRYMHAGASPLSPASDNERLPMEKYNPWALRDVAERSTQVYHRPARAHQITHPNPQDTEALLKTYWGSIHPHWPVLYKPAFDNTSIFRIYDEMPVALLYAMYSLSARLNPTPSLGVAYAERFRTIAEQELQADGMYRSDINTCTTLFLLSIYYHGEGNQRQAWVHSGVAAMMALDLGLHKSTKNLNPVEHERRVRVFWNIYVYEKVLACEMGRPVLIKMAYCDPVRLSEEQADEYETVLHLDPGGFSHTVRLHTISLFNAAVDLFRIFERILSDIHSVSSLTAIRSTRERLVQDLDRELDEWQKSLSPRCAYPVKNDNFPTRCLYICHAWYHVAMILLHRPLIPRPRMGHTYVGNNHHKKATEHANLLVDLLAQFEAGEKIDTLPPNDAYVIFTAANLHVFNLTTNDKRLRDDSLHRLKKCIEWLRGLAETWTAAGSQYKLLLDAFSQVATKTISSSQAFSPSSSSGSSASPTSLTPQAGHGSIYPVPNHMYGIVHQSPQPQPQIHPQTQQSVQTPTQMFPPEAPPGIFPLEHYYWNDFQASSAADHSGQYYNTVQNSEMQRLQTQLPGQVPQSGVYYDVIRLLQEEGRQN